MGDSREEQKPKVFDTCPHCGNKLSPWQQVLLGVDRAVMCKHCWYRIILESSEKDSNAEDAKQNEGDE